MVTFFAYAGAAVAETAGCFAFWAWLRLSSRRGGSHLAYCRWLYSPTRTVQLAHATAFCGVVLDRSQPQPEDGADVCGAL